MQTTPTFRSKHPKLQTSIFAVMTQLANKHQALNLSQGFPDFNSHPRLIERVAHYMQRGDNQYAPMAGVYALREKLAGKMEKQYGRKYDPENEITITAGATEALYAAITAFTHPADEAIVLEPAYDAYAPVVEYSGGRPVFIPLRPSDFSVNWSAVKAAISDKTRLIILNTPHNPTGNIWKPSDMQQLVDITEGTDIIVISDEVYEHILFDGRRHESVCRYPGLAGRSLVISSFGKTYHTTGWKIGYCAAPRSLTSEFRKIHQFITYAVNTPIQHAYADILEDESLYLQLKDFYQQKRDHFRSVLQNSSFRLLDCQGAYFQLADYSDISDLDDMSFVKKLITDHKVAAVPLSPFYREAPNQRFIRFCFAKKDQTIQEAGERLCKI